MEMVSCRRSFPAAHLFFLFRFFIIPCTLLFNFFLFVQPSRCTTNNGNFLFDTLEDIFNGGFRLTEFNGHIGLRKGWPVAHVYPSSNFMPAGQSNLFDSMSHFSITD